MPTPLPLLCPPLLHHHLQAPPRRPPQPIPVPPRWPQLRPGCTPCNSGWQSPRHPRGRRRAGSCLTPSTAPHAAAGNSSLCSLPCDYHHSHANMGTLTLTTLHDARSVRRRDLTREGHHTSVTRSLSTSTPKSTPLTTMGRSSPTPTPSPRHLGDRSPQADDNACRLP